MHDNLHIFGRYFDREAYSVIKKIRKRNKMLTKITLKVARRKNVLEHLRLSSKLWVRILQHFQMYTCTFFVAMSFQSPSLPFDSVQACLHGRECVHFGQQANIWFYEPGSELEEKPGRPWLSSGVVVLGVGSGSALLSRCLSPEDTTNRIQAINDHWVWVGNCASQSSRRAVSGFLDESHWGRKFSHRPWRLGWQLAQSRPLLAQTPLAQRPRPLQKQHAAWPLQKQHGGLYYILYFYILQGWSDNSV